MTGWIPGGLKLPLDSDAASALLPSLPLRRRTGRRSPDESGCPSRVRGLSPDSECADRMPSRPAYLGAR